MAPLPVAFAWKTQALSFAPKASPVMRPMTMALLLEAHGTKLRLYMKR